MSETLLPDPTIRTEHIPGPDDTTVSMGAVDTSVMDVLEPRAETSAELRQRQVAYHQSKIEAAERRIDRAGIRMERLDHKIALYADLGERAIMGFVKEPHPIASREPITTETRARPRTRVEQNIDRNMVRIAMKNPFARSDMRLANTINNPSRPNDRKRRHQMRAIDYAEKTGLMDADEARQAKTAVKAKPLNHGAKFHKSSSKEVNKRNKKALRTLHGIGGWRESHRYSARDKAIGAIQTNHAQAEKHRIALERLLGAPEDVGPRPYDYEIDGEAGDPFEARTMPYDYEAEGDFSDETMWAPGRTGEPREWSEDDVLHGIHLGALGEALRGVPLEGLDLGELEPAVEKPTPDVEAEEDEVEEPTPVSTTTPKEAAPSAAESEPVEAETEEKSEGKSLWDVSVEYVAAGREKHGSSMSMSPESIAKNLIENGVEEDKAAEFAHFIFLKMQAQGIVDKTPLSETKATGRSVLLSADDIRKKATPVAAEVTPEAAAEAAPERILDEDYVSKLWGSVEAEVQERVSKEPKASRKEAFGRFRAELRSAVLDNFKGGERKYVEKILRELDRAASAARQAERAQRSQPSAPEAPREVVVEHTVPAPSPEAERPALPNPWKMALEYVASLRSKHGSNINIKPETIARQLEKMGVSPEEAPETAQTVFKRMQEAKILGGNPVIDENTSRRVLMDAKDILKLREE